MMKEFVLEFVGPHTDGHFDRDANVAPDGVGFNGRRQIICFMHDVDAAPDGPENIAEASRERLVDTGIVVLLHDADTYRAWLEKSAERMRVLPSSD